MTPGAHCDSGRLTKSEKSNLAATIDEHASKKLLNYYFKRPTPGDWTESQRNKTLYSNQTILQFFSNISLYFPNFFYFCLPKPVLSGKEPFFDHNFFQIHIPIGVRQVCYSRSAGCNNHATKCAGLGVRN